MSGWLRIERETGGGFLAPAGVGPSTVCFVEGASGTVSWARRYPVHDADATAAGEWAATAQAVAAAVHRDSVAIVGEGALAALIRLALLAGDHADTLPRVVVETTGSAAGLAAALRLVRQGGRVMLAARPLWTVTPLRTYHDIHRPGISLVPVPWSCDNARPAPGELLAWALAHLAPAQPGRPVRPAPWHRLVVGGHAGDSIDNAEGG